MFIRKQVLNALAIAIAMFSFSINSSNLRSNVLNQSQWISAVQKTIPTTNGSFSVTDPKTNSIVCEWELVTGKAERLNPVICGSADLLVNTYTAMELELARKHPETVSSEMFLKPLADLFKNGIKSVNWQVAENMLKQNFQHFFNTTDFTKYSVDNEIHIFITAKDKQTGTRLGFMQILITPNFDYGTVKIGFFGISEQAHESFVEKLLIGSIFKVLPTVKRIFFHTRKTNENVLALYRNLGFVEFASDMALWTNLEYKADQSDILQKAAKLM